MDQGVAVSDRTRSLEIRYNSKEELELRSTRFPPALLLSCRNVDVNRRLEKDFYPGMERRIYSESGSVND